MSCFTYVPSFFFNKKKKKKSRFLSNMQIKANKNGRRI